MNTTCSMKRTKVSVIRYFATEAYHKAIVPREDEEKTVQQIKARYGPLSVTRITHRTTTKKVNA